MGVLLWKLEASGPPALLDPAAELVADADPPHALAVSLFEDGPGRRRLELLFDHKPDVGEVRAALGIEDRVVEIAFGPVPEQDWLKVSLKSFPAVRAGRFRLHGSHDRAAPGGVVNIRVDAGEAFGTGHHGTTKGCLMVFSEFLKRARPRRILDIGTGTGVLAIAAVKTLRRPVIACDIDEDAVRTTLDNAADNGQRGRVETLLADGLRHARLRGRGRYDLIFANILAGPLIALAPDLMAAAAPGGRFILSGLLEPQERAVAAAYLARGAKRERRLILDGWATLLLRKP